MVLCRDESALQQCCSENGIVIAGVDSTGRLQSSRSLLKQHTVDCSSEIYRSYARLLGIQNGRLSNSVRSFKTPGLLTLTPAIGRNADHCQFFH